MTWCHSDTIDCCSGWTQFCESLRLDSSKDVAPTCKQAITTNWTSSFWVLAGGCTKLSWDANRSSRQQKKRAWIHAWCLVSWNLWHIQDWVRMTIVGFNKQLHWCLLMPGNDGSIACKASKTTDHSKLLTKPSVVEAKSYSDMLSRGLSKGTPAPRMLACLGIKGEGGPCYQAHKVHPCYVSVFAGWILLFLADIML